MSILHGPGGPSNRIAAILARALAERPLAKLAPPATWSECCRHDRRLVALEQHVQATIPHPDDPEFWRKWSAVKRELVRIVGWHCPTPALQSSEAYMLAYDHLLDIFESGGGR